MSFFKRACLFCLRKRLKTLIMLLTLSIIGTLILTGFAIRDASDEATQNVQTAIGGKLILQTVTDGNYDSSSNSSGTTYTYNGDYITQDIVDAISEVDGVVDYTSENPQGFWGAGVNFSYIPAAFNLSYTPYGESSGYTAVLSSEKASDFENGNYSLESGRHIKPDDEHVVMISKELAEYNDLSVGDVMTMYCLDSDSKVELEIIGIFDGTEGSSQDAFSVSDIPANCGYVDYTTMFENFGREIDGYNFLDIYVDDPETIQNIYDEIKALPELEGKTLELSIDTEEYDTVEKPLESLHGLTDTVIVIIVIVSLIILTLILTLWIRGRKKEIGIYLAIGKSKLSIIGQFFTETAMIGAISFALSIFLSRLIAQQAGTFLAAKVASGSSNLIVTVSLEYLLPVYIIGMGIIIASVVLSSITVIRLKPREIFSKMS